MYTQVQYARFNTEAFWENHFLVEGTNPVTNFCSALTQFTAQTSERSLSVPVRHAVKQAVWVRPGGGGLSWILQQLLSLIRSFGPDLIMVVWSQMFGTREHLVFCLLRQSITSDTANTHLPLTHIYNKHTSYVELYDPEQGDEQEVKRDEEAEGPPHVGDALLLPGFVRLHPRTDGRGADGSHRSTNQP